MFGKVLAAIKGNDRVGARNYVAIDENVLSFNLNENFSREFPAYDLASLIDTGSLQQNDDAAHGHIARRWWNIRENGWFGSTLGTLMLNAEVRLLPVNESQRFYSQPHDIHNRFHLLVALHERLQREFTPSWTENDEFGYFLPALAMRIGEDLITQFYDRTFRGQTWTGFGIIQGQKTLTEYFVIPVTKRAYVQLSFTHAPNNNVRGAYFSSHSEPLIARITESLHIEYAAGNALKNTVEQEWSSIGTHAVLNQHKHLFLPERQSVPRGDTEAQALAPFTG